MVFSNFFVFVLLFVWSFGKIFAYDPSLPKIILCKHNAGFFSCFQMVIGMLEAYEQGRYSSVGVDFGKGGLYYDEKEGSNWWNYYFYPLDISAHVPGQPIFLSFDKDKTLLGTWGYLPYYLPRSRSKELIDRYVHVRPAILERVHTFIFEKLHNGPYIGVHYRETDKFRSDSSSLSPDAACEKIETFMKERNCVGLPIFVATDTEVFFQKMREKFGEKVATFSTIRSLDGQGGLHYRKDVSGYQKGLEALVDCLVLSRSCFLIRTSSNLGNCALLFNPRLPSICLNDVQGQSHPEW